MDFPDRVAASVEDPIFDEVYATLFWISEYPNRNLNASDDAVALAEYARQACAKIEGLS